MAEIKSVKTGNVVKADPALADELIRSGAWEAADAPTPKPKPKPAPEPEPVEDTPDE